MAKTKTRKSQSPNADDQHLDETIENLTEEVARTASRYRMPIILFVVICIAGLLLFQVWGKLQGAKIQGQNDEISLVFAGTDEEIRAAVPALIESLRSQKIEPSLVIRFASWLFEKNAEGDRRQALDILVAAQERHPDNLLLPVHVENYRQAVESSAGFVLPEPEPIPALEPIVIDPAGAEGTEKQDANGAAEGDGADSISVPDEQASGEASTDDASTDDASTDDASTDDAATDDATTDDATTDDAATDDASSTDETATEDSANGEAGGEEATSTEGASDVETGAGDEEAETTEGGNGR